MPDAICALLRQAQVAREERDFLALVPIGDRLERQEVYPDAWAALADGSVSRAVQKKPFLRPEKQWSGQAQPGEKLLVLKMMRHVGAQLRMARVVAALKRKYADLDIALCVEPRLIALFTRSFPDLDICSEADLEVKIRECDWWASYERVAQFMWVSSDTIQETFLPLKADHSHSEQLRRSYVGRTECPALIGVSWYSSNTRKDLPEICDWTQFLATVSSTFLSLQYLPDTQDISHMQQSARHGFLADPSIDAHQELDGLAAQIMATDLVVTISNTTAHLAGALGKECIVLLDDNNHLIWPRVGESTIYYPSVTLIRKSGRNWNEVLAETAARISDQMRLLSSSIAHHIQDPLR